MYSEHRKKTVLCFHSMVGKWQFGFQEEKFAKIKVVCLFLIFIDKCKISHIDSYNDSFLCEFFEICKIYFKEK